MANLTNRVGEKLMFKTQQEENHYMVEFEKNVLKRAKMEEKKKNQLIEEQEFKEIMGEKKFEKISRVKDR
jgi:hypothetical protein